MSRNTQYQFISTDTNALVSALVSGYEKITGVSVQPASPEKLFIQWVADIIIQERVQNNYTGNQNIPSRASGENLDALGELFYVSERPTAQPAVCNERFYISEARATAILIPAGTRVTDSSSTLVWETVEDVYVDIGDTYADVQIRCQTPGVVGNDYAVGQINTIIDLFDYYSRCENTTASDSGSDEATDGEFYELMRASMDAYSTAGPQGGYIYIAKRVSTEIADVVANSPVAGTVDLYVLMDDGTIAQTEVKNAVLAACSADTVRPLTDLVSVKDPGGIRHLLHLLHPQRRLRQLSGNRDRRGRGGEAVCGLAVRQAGAGHQPFLPDWPAHADRHQAGGPYLSHLYRPQGREQEGHAPGGDGRRHHRHEWGV